MTNQGSSDQNRNAQQGASTVQGSVENKVKNKLPKVQPYEDISVSAALLGQMMQQLDDALAIDTKPLKSLLAMLAQFNINELLQSHEGLLRAYLSDLNSALQQVSATSLDLAPSFVSPNAQAGQSSPQMGIASANIEGSLSSVEDSELRQVDTQSIMRESMRSVQQSTISLLKAIDIQSLDASFTELNWSVGAVNNSVQELLAALEGNVGSVSQSDNAQANNKLQSPNSLSPKPNGALNNTALEAGSLKAAKAANKPTQKVLDEASTARGRKSNTRRTNTATNKRSRQKAGNTKLGIRPTMAKLSAFKQLDMQNVASDDLTPRLLKAANLKGPANALQTALPALKQLDMQGLAAGDISSLLDAAPSLLKAANLEGPAKALHTAMPALKQLDMQGLAAGDISSLLDAAPGLLKAANLKGPAKALQTAMPALKQLDMQSLAAGDMSSLLDAAPSLLKAINLEGPAKALQTAMPALKQLDMQGLATGDISSLLDAAPGLLKAANLKGPAKALNDVLPAIKQLDIKAVMDGDLQSLVKAGPDLLKAFGFGDAASVFEQHSSAIGKLDFKGTLNGDLSSIGDAATEFFTDFGADEPAQNEKPKRRKKRPSRKRTSKRRASKQRQTQYRSDNKPWAKENRDVMVSKKSQKAKIKTPKPALRVLDGGLDNKVKGFKQAAKPVFSQNKRKLGKRRAANDPIFGVMKKSPGKLGGIFKSLAKSPVTKMLGRFTGPLRTILSAADVATTLSDDSLSKREKSQQIGSAAGGAGGALAGAAAGAAIGSIIPGVGTLIGGAIGGAIGSFGGESIGGFLGDWFGSSLEDEKPAKNEQPAAPAMLNSTTEEPTGNLVNAQSLNMANVDATLGNIAANDSTQTQAITQTTAKSDSTKLSEVKHPIDNVLGAAGNALGPVGAMQQSSSKKSNILMSIANMGGILGNVVNGLSILRAATNDTLSAKEKAQAIRQTGGSWLTGELILGTLGKSKKGKALAPMASWVGGMLAGPAIGSLGGWLTETIMGKEQASTKPLNESALSDSFRNDSSRNDSSRNDSSPAGNLLPDNKNDALAENPSALHRAQSKTSSGTSATQTVNSSVTVNANITVNATPDMSAMDIAEQIKQALEQKQQQAQRDMRLQYIDEVA
ncbi:hypothetical protein PSECIP111854_02077 [Pseudoalteromonas sp. CIP111854]|uniref:Uncharacterized protein n=1 Tax=Pseudoalteromonas holothuriae TaxID=2963714 RepID=A0A9W4VQP3_9GAMM|nr:hypothetical protein [Pseudoalteromonas sp. CIP111854]CAH9057832.1 hypothetical protein PSECIP111854_02077 [Pseudoalteromonas sp. CIP111854]